MTFRVYTRNSTATFSGTDKIATATYNTSDTNLNGGLFAYFGYWFDNAYVPVEKWNVDYNSGDYNIEWTYMGDEILGVVMPGDVLATLHLNLTYTHPGSPYHDYYSNLSVSNVTGISEIFTNNSTIQFFVSFSTTEYPNDLDTLNGKDDVYIYIFNITINNPPKIDQSYYINYYDGSALITSKEIVYSGSRRTESRCPEPITITGAQNANQLGASKPGYRGIGWDTSPNAQNVVYGDISYSGVYVIPANTLSNASPFPLYAVWKKTLNMEVAVSPTERKTTVGGTVVVSVAGSAPTTKEIVAGAVFDGQRWVPL